MFQLSTRSSVPKSAFSLLISLHWCASSFAPRLSDAARHLHAKGDGTRDVGERRQQAEDLGDESREYADVDFVVVVLVAESFGCYVNRRPDLPRHDEAVRVAPDHDPREPKIRDMRKQDLVEEHVPRVQVTVDDSSRVQIAQTVRIYRCWLQLITRVTHGTGSSELSPIAGISN